MTFSNERDKWMSTDPPISTLFCMVCTCLFIFLPLNRLFFDLDICLLKVGFPRQITVGIRLNLEILTPNEWQRRETGYKINYGRNPFLKINNFDALNFKIPQFYFKWIYNEKGKIISSKPANLGQNESSSERERCSCFPP